MTIARMISASLPLASIGKNRKTKIAEPECAERIDRRAGRSGRTALASSGIATNWTAAPISSASSARLRLSLATSTRKVSEKTVRM